MLFSLLLPVIWGCEKWPPRHEELTENFESNRLAFDSLEAKILTSEFSLVSQNGVLGTELLDNPNYVIAKTWVDGGTRSEIVVNDAEWAQYFLQAGVWLVGKYYDGIAMTPGPDLTHRKSSFDVEYVRSASLREWLKPCSSEYEQLKCGACAVDLADNWFIEYQWFPEQIVPGGFDLVNNGVLSEEDYGAMFQENLTRCMKDGYTAIGYDVSDCWDRE